MAHFAKMDANNLVLEVIVVSNDSVANLPFPESEPLGIAFCQSLFGQDTNWLQTSYNASFRGNYAGIGFSYWPDIDQFVSPSPYPSWTYDPVTKLWEAPVPKPYPIPVGYTAVWNEETQQWDLVPVETAE